MTHFCPKCGAFSWHGPGSLPWAIKCPECGKVAAQHPHPPEKKPRAQAARVAKKAAGTKDAGTAAPVEAPSKNP